MNSEECRMMSADENGGQSLGAVEKGDTPSERLRPTCPGHRRNEQRGSVPIFEGQSPFSRTEADWAKGAVRKILETTPGWVTATELVKRLPLETSDPVRYVKKQIEELRDEGCPIVSLPKKPGPGYLWIGDPDAPGAQEIVRMYEEDMQSRMKRMVKHLARIKNVTERQVQRELFETDSPEFRVQSPESRVEGLKG